MTRSQWLSRFFPTSPLRTPAAKKPTPKAKAKPVWVIRDGDAREEIAAPTRSGARWKYKARHGLKKFPPAATVHPKAPA